MISGTEEIDELDQLDNDDQDAGGKGAAADKGKGKDDEKVTLTKAEYDALKRDRDEARQSERDLMDVFRQQNSRRGPAAADQEEEEAEDIDASEFVDDEALDGNLADDTPEKLVDEIAAQGVKALGKRGFVTVKEAQRIAVEAAAKVARQMIGRERQKITSDTQIMTEFPDLKDKNSDLFKETAKLYQEAVRLDPNAKKTPAALYMAAKAASAVLKGKTGGRRRDDDDDDRRYDREDEEDRRARVNAQDSRPRGRVRIEDEDDYLGDQTKDVIRQMGISDDEFTAARKVTGRRSGGRR